MNKVIRISLSIVIGFGIIFGLYKLGYRNVAVTKEAAPRVWSASGYKIVGYEGYQWAPLHGSAVWYILQKENDNGILYHGALAKWGNEYHIYCLSAIDALKPLKL